MHPTPLADTDTGIEIEIGIEIAIERSRHDQSNPRLDSRYRVRTIRGRHARAA